jgi:hypothetical protein
MAILNTGYQNHHAACSAAPAATELGQKAHCGLAASRQPPRALGADVLAVSDARVLG